MQAFLAKFACIFDVQSACLFSLSAIVRCVYVAVFLQYNGLLQQSAIHGAI